MLRSISGRHLVSAHWTTHQVYRSGLSASTGCGRSGTDIRDALLLRVPGTQRPLSVGVRARRVSVAM